MAHLQIAIKKSPDSPLVRGTMAGLEMRLGEYASAVRDLESALASAAGPGDERLRQRRTLRVYLADALVADWRMDRAERILRTVGNPATLPSRERQGVERLNVQITATSGGGAAGPHPPAPSPSPPWTSAPRAHAHNPP